MLKQYKILNRCLSELKTSSMPIIKKLKLEVHLIKLKWVLLYRNLDERIFGLASCEQQFQGLFIYNHVRLVCLLSDAEGEIDSLNKHLEELRIDLAECARGGYGIVNLKTNKIRRKILNTTIRSLFCEGSS